MFLGLGYLDALLIEMSRGSELRKQKLVKNGVNLQQQQQTTTTHLPQSSVNLNGAFDIFLNSLCAKASASGTPQSDVSLSTSSCFSISFLSVIESGTTSSGTSRESNSIRKSSIFLAFTSLPYGINPVTAAVWCLFLVFWDTFWCLNLTPLSSTFAFLASMRSVLKCPSLDKAYEMVANLASYSLSICSLRHLTCGVDGSNALFIKSLILFAFECFSVRVSGVTDQTMQ